MAGNVGIVGITNIVGTTDHLRRTHSSQRIVRREQRRVADLCVTGITGKIAITAEVGMGIVNTAVDYSDDRAITGVTGAAEASPDFICPNERHADRVIALDHCIRLDIGHTRQRGQCCDLRSRDSHGHRVHGEPRSALHAGTKAGCGRRKAGMFTVNHRLISACCTAGIGHIAATTGIQEGVDRRLR